MSECEHECKHEWILALMTEAGMRCRLCLLTPDQVITDLRQQLAQANAAAETIGRMTGEKMERREG